MEPDLESFPAVLRRSRRILSLLVGPALREIAIRRGGSMWNVGNAGAILRSHLEVKLNPNLLRRREFIMASGPRGEREDLWISRRQRRVPTRRFPGQRALWDHGIERQIDPVEFTGRGIFPAKGLVWEIQAV